MPRAALLTVILFLSAAAALSQAGGLAQAANPFPSHRKPWDPPAVGPGATLFSLNPLPPPPGLTALNDSVPSAAGQGQDSVRGNDTSQAKGASDQKDSSQAKDSLQTDSAAAPRGPKDSWTAVGLSAILPGAGQIYTENYWKVPVILGLGAYWIYEWNQNDDKYDEYHDLYEQSIQDLPPDGNEQYLQLREAYKDQRDAFAWYLGILYLVNVVDAYVGAELYDFDVGPNLGAGGTGAQATLRIHL